MQKNSEVKIGVYLAWLCSCVFLFSWLRNSSQVIAILLLLSSAFLYFKKERRIDLDGGEKCVIYGMLAMFFAGIVSFLWSGLDSNPWTLNSYVNYLPCALLAFFLLSLRVDLPRKMIFYAIAVAGIFNGLFAFYQAFILNIARVYGAFGIFEFSQTSGAICLILAALLLFAQTNKERVLYCLGFVFSFSAVVLSVTRGTYVGLLIGFTTLIFLLLIFGYRKKALAIFTLLIVCVGAWGVKFAFSTNHDPLNVKAFQRDLKLYEQGAVNTSNGLRIEMWKEAIAIFKLSPIFGMHSALVDRHLEEILTLSGTKRYAPEHFDGKNPTREQIIRGIIGDRHNQLFDILAKTGIVGTLALLFLILSIMSVFWKGCKEVAHHSICFAGLSILLFFGGCGIGDSLFTISNSTIVFMMAVFTILLKLKSQNHAL